jgi:hypothetical protein
MAISLPSPCGMLDFGGVAAKVRTSRASEVPGAAELKIRIRRSFLGDRLMAERRILAPSIKVRILVPQQE